MLNLRLRGLAAAAILFLATAATATAAQTYPIKIQRPMKVGETFALSATADMRRSVTVTTATAQPQQNAQENKVQLDGTVQIGAVDDKGIATQMTCTVDQCLLNDQALFPKGTVIVGELVNGKPQYTADGKPVEPVNAAQLLTVLTLADAKDRSRDDAIFGSDTPRQVGDSWSVDAAAAADSLSKNSFAIKKEDIKGTSKLVSATNMDGIDVLHIEADVSAPKLAGMQVGKLTVTDGSISAHFSGDYPVDLARQPLRQMASMDMTVHGTAQDKNGNPITLDLAISYNKTATMGDVKK